MFNQSQGLSLDQAPPFLAPARFFLTAPIFGVLLGCFLLFFAPELYLDRYTPQAIAMIHLVTLGMMSMVMIGALTQMLPVLAGITIPKVLGLSIFVHFTYTLGTLAFSFSFLLEDAFLKKIALVFLALGFGSFLAVTVVKLLKVSFLNDTVRSMRFALFCAVLTLILGLFLLDAHAFERIGAWQYKALNAHVLFGVLGWTAILIVGVSYQVVPMFYVTQPYEKKFAKGLSIGLVSVIILIASLGFFIENAFWLTLTGRFVIAVLLIAFAIKTILKLRSRRRPIVDTTILYWYTSMSFLILASVLFVLEAIFTTSFLMQFCVLAFGAGFALSVIFGMLYKIVSFLVWFHLSNMGHFDIPTMRDLVPEKKTRLQFNLFAVSLACMFVGVLIPILFKVAGALFILSNVLLFKNLLFAVKVYLKKSKEKPAFDMGMGQ